MPWTWKTLVYSINFHVQTPQIQPNAASSTKCSRNQRKYLKALKEQTLQRVRHVQADLLSPGAAALLCRRRGLLGGERGGGCLRSTLCSLGGG